MNRDKIVRYLTLLMVCFAHSMKRDIIIQLPSSFPHETMNASVTIENTYAGSILHAIKQRYWNYIATNKQLAYLIHRPNVGRTIPLKEKLLNWTHIFSEDELNRSNEYIVHLFPREEIHP